MNDRIQSIFAICANEKNAYEIADELGIHYSTARTYAITMSEHGLLAINKGKINDNGRPLNFYTQAKEPTDKDCRAVMRVLSTIRAENRAIYRKREKPLKRQAKKELEPALDGDVKMDNDAELVKSEAKGIYLLSSKPSNHFKDLFKQQSGDRRGERKSPRNYVTGSTLSWL